MIFIDSTSRQLETFTMVSDQQLRKRSDAAATFVESFGGSLTFALVDASTSEEVALPLATQAFSLKLPTASLKITPIQPGIHADEACSEIPKNLFALVVDNEMILRKLLLG